jgi:glycosyltransferase involved in cell wall biosynthesis
MKILWFTNTPSLAADLLKQENLGGGWIGSLEKKLTERNDIDLAVAFQFNQSYPSKLKGPFTTYYLVPLKNNVFRKFYRRHFNIIDIKKNIDHYLNIIEDFKPDVIHIFGTENDFGLIANKTKIPIIIHLQGIITVCDLKWIPNRMNNNFLLKTAGLKNLLIGNSFYHNRLAFNKMANREQKIFSNSKYFMGRTDWDRRMSKVLSPGSQYFQCEEMIRPQFMSYIWNKEIAGDNIFISTIQGNIYKGLETVLEAASLLHNSIKIKFEWRIAGISETDKLVKLIEKWTKLNFKKNNVRFLGPLKPGILLEQMLQSDIFIHPSHIDNSPNSVCEAMLIGMPVIATFTGGTGSLLTDKEEGVLIQDGDPYSMAGAILELLNNYAFASRLGQNARHRALLRHDPDEIILNLISIYHQLSGLNNIK